MNIGIYETEHFEGAYPVVRLFDNGQHAITIYTNQHAYLQFQFLFGKSMNRYTWVVMEEKETKRQFILRVRKLVGQHETDLLYLNTVGDNFIFFALLVRSLQKKRVVLTLHDINTWFEYRHAWTIRRWVRHIGKRMLIRLTNEFNVVSLPMVGYLMNKLPPNKKVFCVPGAFYDPMTLQRQVITSGERIRIVVPGTIDQKRRDYASVFALLAALHDLGVPVRITLLGGHTGSYGAQILDKCRSYNRQHDDLLFYEDAIVPQPEFDRVMDESHFVWIPSVIHTVIADDVDETYGVSKSSGNLFDIIKHAKPFLIPKSLQVDAFLETSCFRYSDENEIAGFLREIDSDRGKYDNLQTQAIHNSEHYTLEKIRDRNPALFGHAVMLGNDE